MAIFLKSRITIFTALLTVSESREVKIFMDSQSCIDNFHKMLSPHPKFTKKKLFKIRNWSIWTKIIEASQSKRLIIKLIKVKAHNGDYFNDQANLLAKEALNFPTIEIAHKETGPIIVSPTWKNMPIDIFTREFVKEINKKTINFQWSRQNRNIKMFF